MTIRRTTKLDFSIAAKTCYVVFHVYKRPNDDLVLWGTHTFDTLNNKFYRANVTLSSSQKKEIGSIERELRRHKL